MIATSRRRLTAHALLAAAGLALPALAQSPQGGQVVAGQASINQNGNYTGITASNGAVINWQSFSIGQGQTVQFYQPSASSRVLNRVTGPDPSLLAGTLLSNGIVYISNSAGVYFAHGSLVNVGGIYAAAGNISNADFLAGRNHFTGVQGVVRNDGVINSPAAHLIGQRVANFGTINSPNGMVTMTAGSDVYIGEQGGQIFARVEGAPASGGTGVTQAGDINAAGGRVRLGAGDMYAVAIDHPGRTVARNITLQGGHGSPDPNSQGGIVSVSGTLDASDLVTGHTGGTIKVLGDRVGVFGAGVLDASGAAGGGTILVGGNRQGQGPETNSRATYISPDAVVRADATGNGNGGSIVIWSDNLTRAYGHISARGGLLGGNGGFIETSGKHELQVSRTPDVRARVDGARAGTWLIDPDDLTFGAAGSGNTNIVTSGSTVFTSSGAGATLDVGVLVGALSGGATVEVRTGASGNAAGGTITLPAGVNIDYNGTGTNTLSLFAHRRIVLDGQILDSNTGSADVLNLNLTADVDMDGTGNIFVNNLVDTGGGDFTVLRAVNFDNTGGQILTHGGDVSITLATTAGVSTLGADINAGSGTVTVNSDVVLSDDVTVTGGNVTFARTIDSAATPHSLDVMITGTGLARFFGEIGGESPLFSLSVDSTAHLGQTRLAVGSITTTRGQTWGHAVTLVSDTTMTAGDAVVFRSTLNSTAGGAFDLSVTAPVVNFNSQVGNAGSNTGLGTLVVSGGVSTINTAVMKGEAFDFISSVTLAFDLTITGTTRVRFLRELDSRAGEHRNLAVNSPITTFARAVGGASGGELGFLTTDAVGTTRLSAGAMNVGTVIFNDSVVVGADTVLTATTAATFGSTLNSTFGQANDLTINSPLTTFMGEVGGFASGELGILSTDAAGTAHLHADITAQQVSFREAVVLHSDITVTGTNEVNFDGTVDSASGGAHNLTVNTLLGRFHGEIGGSTGGALGALVTDTQGTTTIEGEITAASLTFNDTVVFSGGLITTTGDQTYNGAFNLGADTVLSGHNVTFGLSVDSDSSVSDRSLTINTNGNGDTVFNGPVGSLNPLSSLTTNADGRVLMNGGVINTSGDQTYSDPVILSITMAIGCNDITFGQTINSDSVARALSINTTGAGVTTFSQAIGNLSPLESLITNADGKTRLAGGTVTAQGSVAFNDDVIMDADMTLVGSSVAFGSKLDSGISAKDLIVNTVGGGVTSFSGAVGSSSPLASITTNADGTTQFFGASIRTNGDQIYHDAVTVGADCTITAENITFDRTIDCTELLPNPAGLTINSQNSGTTTFSGAIGATNPLKFITTDAGGVTKIGGNITTSGGTMTFNDTVRITNDVVLTDTGGTGVIFGSTVDSEGSAHALSILLNTSSNATAGAPAIAHISFSGNVGSAFALSSLTLGGNRTVSPAAATIFGGINAGAVTPNFALVITTNGDFTMGVGQKLAIIGDLTINAGGTARLGDISTLGNMTINAPSIVINTRPSGANLFTINGSSLSTSLDTGVDFVAGGTITFSTAPTASGPFGPASFATPGAAGISSTLTGFAQRDVGSVSATIMHVGGLVLDLSGTGPSNANVSEALAGALPKEEQVGLVFRDTAAGKAQQDALAELGIATNPADAKLLADLLSGRAFYNDAAARDPWSQGYAVTINRLSARAVAEVLNSYRTVFFKDGQQQADKVRDTLAAAWKEYSAAAGDKADALGFRAYCEAVPAQAQAVYYLDGLRDLFSQLGYLGLSPSELRHAKATVLRAVQVPGMSAAQLEAAITATNMGTVALK